MNTNNLVKTVRSYGFAYNRCQLVQTLVEACPDNATADRVVKEVVGSMKTMMKCELATLEVALRHWFASVVGQNYQSVEQTG